MVHSSPRCHTWGTLTPAERGEFIMAQSQSDDFLTVAEVARRLRVSNMTVYRLINAGQLPAARIGKSYRIRDADVDVYLENSYTQAG